MSLLTQHDFETTAGQKKIITVIHSLERKVHELDRMVHDLAHKENILEHDFQGYGIGSESE